MKIQISPKIKYEVKNMFVGTFLIDNFQFEYTLDIKNR